MIAKKFIPELCANIYILYIILDWTVIDEDDDDFPLVSLISIDSWVVLIVRIDGQQLRQWNHFLNIFFLKLHRPKTIRLIICIFCVYSKLDKLKFYNGNYKLCNPNCSLKLSFHKTLPQFFFFFTKTKNNI